MTSKQIKDLIRNQAKRNNIDAQILLRNYMLERLLERSVSNFNPPAEHTPDCVSGYNSKSCRDFELKLGTPAEFFKEIEKNMDRICTVSGDFNPVFQGCYSARIAVKQWNRYLENLLFTGEVFNAKIPFEEEIKCVPELKVQNGNEICFKIASFEIKTFKFELK